MLTRALMDLHYGKPKATTRAATRTSDRQPANPIPHTTEMPDNGQIHRPDPLAFEKSRLVP